MTVEYISPIGKIYVTSDGEYLTEIEFFTSSHEVTNSSDNVTEETIRWLDLYFSGIAPDFTPKLKLSGSDFSRAVLSECAKLKYGEICTYGDIAKKIAAAFQKKPCARAVGGALNRNPVPIIIPCHRVIGKNNNMVGFAPGVETKIKLLELEGYKK